VTSGIEGNFETIPLFGQEQCSSISAMKQQSTSTNAVQAEWLALGNFIPNILRSFPKPCSQRKMLKGWAWGFFQT
jgi:hypothetical protein